MQRPGRRHRHPRVLVIDDSATVRRVARRTLEAGGYEVAVADDGRSGLEAAQVFVPDLVLLDAVMSGLDGEGFCRAMRGISNLQATPVVLMSARAHSIADAFMDRTGAVDAIQKPFAPEALLAVTAHALQRDEPPREDPFADSGEAAEAACRERAGRVVDALTEFLAPLYGEDVRYVLATTDAERCVALAEQLGRLAFEGEAALQGSLQHVALGDVLQLLQQPSMSGILHVESDDGRAVQICLTEGCVDLVVGRGVPPEFLLGRYLVRDNLIEPAELAAHLRRPARGKGRLGEQFVRLGYISREDLQEALARQSSELVYEALRWPRGRFALLRYATRPEAEAARLGLPITSILMEGLRRVDEWRLIEEQVSSFELVPRIDPQVLADVDTSRMSADERTVLAAIDGMRTVRDIVDHTWLGRFEACKVLFQLLVSRVVRV